jgi:hypothetical protein
MLLFAHQLSILLLLSLSASLRSGAAFPHLARLGSLGLFGILAIDLGENLLYARVGVRVDEVAEQISQTEEVSKAANRIVFLWGEAKSVMYYECNAPMTSRTLDALRPSAFLPYMLFRIFISSARRFRPSTGALSPATLFAVVLGLVSESYARVSLSTEWMRCGVGVFVLCNRVYQRCTVPMMLALSLA